MQSWIIFLINRLNVIQSTQQTILQYLWAYITCKFLIPNAAIADVSPSRGLKHNVGLPSGEWECNYTILQTQ